MSVEKKLAALTSNTHFAAAVGETSAEPSSRTSKHQLRKLQTYSDIKETTSLHPTHLAQHGQHPQPSLPLRHPRRSSLLLRLRRTLRCQRRHPCGDLRSFEGSLRPSGQRRHALPRTLAAEGYKLRCPHQTPEYQHHDRKQGFADGELDAQGVASAGGWAVA